MRAFTATLALAALLVPAWAFGDYYRYETDEGVLSFVDDIRQIPSRYRDRARPEEEQSLFEHARVTLVPRGATRAASVTALAGAESAPLASPGQGAAGGVEIGSNPSNTTIHVPAGSDQTVQIERTTEWKWRDGRYVPHAVVKVDGRVISVTRLR